MSMLSDRNVKKKRETEPEEQGKTPADPLAGVAMTAEELEAGNVVEASAPATNQSGPAVDVEPLPSPARAPRVRVLEDVRKFMIGGTHYRFKKGDVLDSNHYEDRRFRDILSSIHTEPVED